MIDAIFPQLEEQIVPGSHPATFRLQLTTTSHGIRTPAERASSFKARLLNHSATEAPSEKNPQTNQLDIGVENLSYVMVSLREESFPQPSSCFSSMIWCQNYQEE